MPAADRSIALPIAKNPWVSPRSVIGAMNTRASRTIVTQSVPKASSSAAGFARTTAACAHAGISPAVCIPARTGLVRARAAAISRLNSRAYSMKPPHGPSPVAKSAARSETTSTSRSYPDDAATSTVEAMRTPANSGSWLNSHAMSVPNVTGPPIAPA